MQKSLLAVASAFCALSMTAAVTPSTLPDGITVSPVQGVVDISGSADVRGVTEITFTFPAAPEVNPDATGNFCIYLDGSDTPAEELPVAGNAVIDPMGMPMGGFTFKHVYKDPGTFKITVPAGVWTYGEGLSNPAMTLFYEILPGVESYPAAGVVGELMEINLTVPGVSRVNVNPTLIDFYTLAGGDIEFNAVADGSDIFITPKNMDDVSGNNTYFLDIKAGAITWMDGESEVSNIETRFQYVKTDIPKPAIAPAEGPVEAFGDFTVTMPEDFKLGFYDTMGWSYLYAFKGGKRLSDPVLKYSLKNVDGKAVFYPVDSEGKEITEPVKLEAGGYEFVPAPQYAFGDYKDTQFVSIPPYTYSFRIEGEINPDDCFVKGHVTLPDGTPAVGASVMVMGGNDYYEYAGTDENGLYVVTNMPADPTGNFSITAFDADFIYSFEAKNVSFPELKNNVYDIAFKPAAVEGYELNVTVTEESGYSINGAAVKVNKIDETATTDNLGIARFVIPAEVGTEGLSVTVTKSGYTEKTQNITWTEGADSMDVTVVLTPAESGVAGIDADSEVRYFNLQGGRIEAPARGQVVIRVVGGSATKVIL